MTDDLTWWTAVDLAGAIATSQVSATEAIDAYLAAVDARNPELNVVVTLDADRARDEARRVDAAVARGDELGPLAGVPMTVKDSLMRDGVRTTSGAPEYRDYVADSDAAPVAAMRGAGAIVFGKTNLPLYAGDVQSYNDVFGTSNNPWDTSRSVGGSSGGSAGALAAGLTPLEIGSDIAGSIRNPAAMCGVVGHKSSYGICSARGQIPGPPGSLTQADIAVVGPMARSVADAQLALEILAGPDDWTATAWSLQLPPARTVEPRGLRVAIMATDPYCPVDPEIEAAINDIARALESAGASVDSDARPEAFDFAKADATFDTLLGAAMSGGFSVPEIEGMSQRQAEGERLVGDLGIAGVTTRHRAWLGANERRLQMRKRWRTFFESWDVVLAPISPTVAIPHDHSPNQSERTIEVAGETRPYNDQMRWMGLFGIVYLPATAVPIGVHSSGLPMALQVVGPFLEDHTTLAVAAMIETITGGTPRPAAYR
ncbi:MAG: amidase [Acidimicrobiales bacterium]|jgi:amidase